MLFFLAPKIQVDSQKRENGKGKRFKNVKQKIEKSDRLGCCTLNSAIRSKHTSLTGHHKYSTTRLKIIYELGFEVYCATFLSSQMYKTKFS